MKSEFKILIVENTFDLCEMIKFHLNEIKNLSVTMTNDGFKAFKILKEDPSYDLVLTDYHMPVWSGLRLFEEIKLSSGLENLDIIYFSSELDRTLINQLYNLGAKKFFTKPTQTYELFSYIEDRCLKKIEER